MKNKKLFVLFLFLVLCFLVALSSCAKGEEKPIYFKNYNSTPLYSQTEKLLSLPENYEFSSYDAISGLFEIKRNILADKGGTDIRYGLCTENKILIEPLFSEIIDIRNNHAIVVTKEYLNNELKEKIGIINIKESPLGFETGDSFTVEYDNQINQYTFLDDSRLVVIGGKNPVFDFNNNIDYSFAIVYDYCSSNTLLEIGRISGVSSGASFNFNDGYISAAMPGQVRFYDFCDIQNGEFKEVKKHVPFRVAEVDHNYVEVVPYYLGNYEYILVGIRAESTTFDGFDMVRTGADGEAEYIKILARGYNVKSNKEFDVGKVLIVANSYSSELINTITKVYEESISLGYTKDYELYKNEYSEEDFYKYVAEKIYDYPLIETQKLAKDGHSILYEAFLTGTTKEGQKIYSTSFVMYTPEGKTTLIENAYLPLLFIDGYGVERIDPNYSLFPEDAKFYSYYDGEITSILKSEDKIAYSQYLVHDKVLIVEKNDLSSQTNVNVMQKFGAIDVETQKVILDFEYDFITPFFGGHSIAGKYTYRTYEESEEEYIYSVDYWRVSKNKEGKATLSPIHNVDVYSVNNGTYTTRVSKKFGLYSNDGKQLFPEEFDEITVLDLTLKDDRMFDSYVFGKQGEVWNLYKLK